MDKGKVLQPCTLLSMSSHPMLYASNCRAVFKFKEGENINKENTLEMNMPQSFLLRNIFFLLQRHFLIELKIRNLNLLTFLKEKKVMMEKVHIRLGLMQETQELKLNFLVH